MADEISRVAYSVAALPHKAGEAARVLTAFKEAGMNLRGCLGYRKTARNAEIIFVVDEKTPGVSAAGKKAALTQALVAATSVPRRHRPQRAPRPSR